jgi:flagellar motor switch protein FliN/FliY
MNTRTSMNDGMFYPDDNDLNGNISLSEAEQDALGEIGNICMGTSATTLSTLLGKRVTITTPKVSISRGNEYLDEYEKPVVLTEVQYTQGIDGGNTFLIKKEDALLITCLLMGNDPADGLGDELEEFYLSAISEVMNQMVGSSSTALATALHVQVNISPPVIRELTSDEKYARRQSDEVAIVISFRMEIENLLVSNIMQIMPYEFGKKLVSSLYGEENIVREQSAPEQITTNKESVGSSMDVSTGKPAYSEQETHDVDLKAVKFQSFDTSKYGQQGPGSNIDLIIDVPLQVTVVLGKTKKNIREILELGMGSIIVLDRLAGEMVDVLVNGKLFARGEVVVINDNYGVRITELTEAGQIKS